MSQKNPRISEEKSWDILGLNLRNFSGFPRISHDNSAQVSLLILSFQKAKTNPINIAVSWYNKHRLGDSFNFVRFLLDVLKRSGGMVKVVVYYSNSQCGSVCIEENICKFYDTCLTQFITIKAVLNSSLEMHLLLQDFNFYFSSSNLNPKANTSLIENFLVILLKLSRSTLTEKE